LRNQFNSPNHTAMKNLIYFIVMLAFICVNEASGQWNTSGNNIYNTNTGNVGIGNSSPTTLLHVAKNMTEPTITVQNLGGSGGATYTMIDNASGANWKFKATLSGGFKIRDHANLLDVFVIEPNSAANAIYINSAGSVGIGTAAPANSSLVDMSSTSKGFLPPRMTQGQMTAISSPADGLIVYCTTDGKLYIFVASSGAWKEIAFGSGSLPVFTCGVSLNINHVAGAVAPVTKSVTYGTVTNVPGETSKCWITRNLGASNQASSVSDATEAAAGWYWQFNRMQGYKNDGATVTPSWTITSINENSDWLLANDPCYLLLGTGWRLPSYTEWNNVLTGGSWSTWNEPWGSLLKMHAAGYLQSSDGSLTDRGIYGKYWSSNQSSNFFGNHLQFNSGTCFMFVDVKAYGFPVRCIHD